jgi:hypothetical protein
MIFAFSIQYLAQAFSLAYYCCYNTSKPFGDR